MQNELKLYVKSMGKIFRIRHIANRTDDANTYCRKHSDTGVVAEDTDLGLIFIADLYGSKAPATLIVD